jgi:hypothetical protein
MGNTRIDQTARAKARQRRLDMEHDRAARDTRIEHAAAAVFTALAAKTRAEQDVHTAEGQVGQSLRRLLQEGLTSTQAAQLCDLPPTAVQRLLRRYSSDSARQRTTPAATRSARAGGGDDAAAGSDRDGAGDD